MSTLSPVPRVFAAIAVPPGHHRALLAQHRGIEAATWERWPHITVAHFGSQSDSTVDELCASLRAVEFSAFELILGDIGFFGADVMWVGVEPSQSLLTLAQKLGSIREQFSDAPERYGFSPHLTLARITESGTEELARYVDGFDYSVLEPFFVRTFSLFTSDYDGYRLVADFDCEHA